MYLKKDYDMDEATNLDKLYEKISDLDIPEEECENILQLLKDTLADAYYDGAYTFVKE